MDELNFVSSFVVSNQKKKKILCCNETTDRIKINAKNKWSIKSLLIKIKNE